MTILDAMADPNLFGGLAAFRDVSTWARWKSFLAAVFGLPMSASDLATFRTHTGLQSPRSGGYPEAVAIVGCQSGKTAVAALVASYDAALAEDSRPGDGEIYSLMIAQDLRASTRTLFSYAAAPFEHVPLFRQEVLNRTAEAITLRNGTVLAAYPCRPAAIRGLRARVVVLDELAYYRSSDGHRVDTEMLRAARTRLATTGGKLLILSSPYAQSGALWDLYRKNYGKDTPILVWQGSAAEMNPTLPVDYLERMREDDPEAYRSEVLGEFRAGVTSLFDPDALNACVVTGRRELPPVSGVRYSAFVDPSGGRRDAFTCAIGHRESNRIIVDVLRAWSAPFNPSGVVAECADLLKTYGVGRTLGDRYAGSWPSEAFGANGIPYEASAKDRSALYLEFLPQINAGTVELLDAPDLLRELRGLERRRGPSGRDRVDHSPGSHDDRANSVAGVASLLTRERTDPGITITGYSPAPDEPSLWTSEPRLMQSSGWCWEGDVIGRPPGTVDARGPLGRAAGISSRIGPRQKGNA